MSDLFFFARRRSSRRPLYYITFSWVCQEVFQKFFKLFYSLFVEVWVCTLTLLLDLFLWSPPFCWRLDYYITSGSLCQEVFQKFLNFFRCPASAPFRFAVSLTARLLYHSSSSLSIPFSNFFLFFWYFFRISKNKGASPSIRPCFRYGFWSLG